MDNIFKNAYFGKAYKTRDGRKAIYLQLSFNKHLHFVVVEKEIIAECYTDCGSERNGEDELDIVSEWKEET